jgi:hypothetical protein
MTKGEKIVIVVIFHRFSFQCVMDLSSMCGGRGGQEPFLSMACKTFYGDLNLFIYLSMFAYYAYLHE